MFYIKVIGRYFPNCMSGDDTDVLTRQIYSQFQKVDMKIKTRDIGVTMALKQ